MATEAVCGIDAVPLGEARGYVVGSGPQAQAVAIVHTADDEWFALEDRCSHGRQQLSVGFVEDKAIECIAHGAMFDLESGNPLCPPASSPVKTFNATVVDGVVHVEL